MTRKKKNGVFWNIFIILILVIRSKVANFNKISDYGENILIMGKIKVLIKCIGG